MTPLCLIPSVLTPLSEIPNRASAVVLLLPPLVWNQILLIPSSYHLTIWAAGTHFFEKRVILYTKFEPGTSRPTIFRTTAVGVEAVKNWVRRIWNKAQILDAQNLHFPYSWPKHWVSKCAPCAPSSQPLLSLDQAAKSQKVAKRFAMSMILMVLMINTLILNQLENSSW